MIKKYNEYIKESLLDKIKGPTEEEVLNTYGFSEKFNNINDFLDILFSKLKIKETDDYDYYILNDDIFLVYDYEEEIVKLNTKIFKLIEDVFNEFPYDLFRNKVKTNLKIKDFKLIC